MQRMSRLLGAEDARRRALAQCICALLVTVVFFLLLFPAGGGGWLTEESPGDRTAVLLICCVMLLSMLVCLALWKRWAWPTFLYVILLVTAALYMRMAVLDVKTGDYESFLTIWVGTFRDEGFSAITRDIGDYNLPYMYIIAGLARLPMSELYSVKLVSILFDLLLALLMMQMVSRFLKERYALLTLSVMLVMPTLWFNSAYWAQCDSIYVFFTLACLYAMLADRPVLSVALLTVAFGFKIQTIFFFPMVLYGLHFKKYKLCHALVFPVVYLALMLPALLMGRSLISALTIYLRQASQYTMRLTNNAPNIYQFFPDVEVGFRNEFDLLKYIPGVTGSEVDWAYPLEYMRRISQALIPFAAVLILAAAFYLIGNRKYLKPQDVWTLSLFSALLIPMVLPKMHERYFILAEMFALLYGLRHPKRFYVPILVILSSFFSYYPYLFRHRQVDMRLVSLMMLAALCIVGWDLVRGIRRARRADTGLSKEDMEPTYTIP